MPAHSGRNSLAVLITSTCRAPDVQICPALDLVISLATSRRPRLGNVGAVSTTLTRPLLRLVRTPFPLQVTRLHANLEQLHSDQIRPDWEDKLKAVKAAVARRANRRIIMRQVNGRLIPIGVTSGRIQVMEDGEQGNAEEGSGSRSRRRGPPGELGTLLQSMGMGVTGQDLDEVRVSATPSNTECQRRKRRYYFKRPCGCRCWSMS